MESPDVNFINYSQDVIEESIPKYKIYAEEICPNNTYIIMKYLTGEETKEVLVDLLHRASNKVMVGCLGQKSIVQLQTQIDILNLELIIPIFSNG